MDSIVEAFFIANPGAQITLGNRWLIKTEDVYAVYEKFGQATRVVSAGSSLAVALFFLSQES